MSALYNVFHKLAAIGKRKKKEELVRTEKEKHSYGFCSSICTPSPRSPYRVRFRPRQSEHDISNHNLQQRCLWKRWPYGMFLRTWRPQCGTTLTLITTPVLLTLKHWLMAMLFAVERFHLLIKLLARAQWRIIYSVTAQIAWVYMWLYDYRMRYENYQFSEIEDVSNTFGQAFSLFLLFKVS